MEGLLPSIAFQLAATCRGLGRTELVTTLWALAELGLRDRAACQALLEAAADAVAEHDATQALDSQVSLPRLTGWSMG